MRLESLDRYTFPTSYEPLAEILVRADVLAARAEVAIHEWDEDGLGPARGFCVRLPSGRVIGLEEFELAVRHHPNSGTGVIVDASDLASVGAEALVAELLRVFDLSRSEISWMAGEAEERAASERAEQVRLARAKRNSPTSTEPFLRPPSIGRLMAAIAVMAVMLGLYRDHGEVGIFLVVLLLIEFSFAWRAARGRRRLAGRGFGLMAAFANVVVGGICVYLVSQWGAAIFFLLMILWFPPMAGFGLAWALEVSRGQAEPLRSRLTAWICVLVFAALPVWMMASLWPLRLAFFLSRPALTRLADRVSAGEPLALPEWAGLYRVVAARNQPLTGDVALIIDNNPAGACGFVRFTPLSSTALGPMFNLEHDEALDDTWRYQTED